MSKHDKARPFMIHGANENVADLALLFTLDGVPDVSLTLLNSGDEIVFTIAKARELAARIIDLADAAEGNP